MMLRLVVFGLVSLVLLAPSGTTAEGSKPNQNTTDKRPTKIWNRTGPLGETPKHVTDAYPLSDQENKNGWVKFEPISDEFEGTELDRNRWTVGLEWWKGRQPALFSEKNVTVSGGKLHLTMRREKLSEEFEKLGYKDYTSAALHSKARCGYGYYEVKAKPMNSGGSSSFWFQVEETPGWLTEIDVFEIGGRAKGFEQKYNMNLHVFRTPQEKKHWSVGGVWVAPWRLANDYHVYGLDWDKDGIKYFVDGVLVRSVENTHWHQPLYLIFDSETMPQWFGMPDDKDLPSTFNVDYVRAWTSSGGNAQDDKPSQVATSPAKPDERVEMARTFVAQMAAGRFAVAVEPFDEVMKKAAPSDKLQAIWDGLVKQHGPLERTTETRTEQIQQYRAVYVTCQFQRGPLDAKVVFNSDNKISGLFFVPAGKYKPPAYADFLKFEEKEISIGKGIFALPGTLALPKGAVPFPAVVLEHGSGPNDRDETIGPNKHLRKPMLILQGEGDYQATMEDFANWKKALGSQQDVKLASYPKLNHLFMEGEGKSTPDEYLQPGNVALNVIEDIAKWIEGLKP